MSIKENLIAAKALIDTPEKLADIGGDAQYALIRAVGRGPISDIVAMAAPLNSAIPKWTHKVRSSKDHPWLAYCALPSTTHTDIMALFDRAIAAQGETP